MCSQMPTLSEFEVAKLKKTLAKSDDGDRHADLFFKAARVLIENGTMTIWDFEAFGGWVRSCTAQYSYFVFPEVRADKQGSFYLNTMTKQLWVKAEKEPLQL